MWYRGQRVVLARTVRELGGGPSRNAGLMGTIVDIFPPVHMWLVNSHEGSIWADVDCHVEWDDASTFAGGPWWQQLSQLEPVIPDSERGSWDAVRELMEETEGVVPA